VKAPDQRPRRFQEPSRDPRFGWILLVCRRSGKCEPKLAVPARPQEDAQNRLSGTWTGARLACKRRSWLRVCCPWRQGAEGRASARDVHRRALRPRRMVREGILRRLAEDVGPKLTTSSCVGTRLGSARVGWATSSTSQESVRSYNYLSREPASGSVTSPQGTVHTTCIGQAWQMTQTFPRFAYLSLGLHETPGLGCASVAPALVLCR